jgi:predicted transcriptional regulator
MITGFWVSQAIFAAAKLGIADLLKDGPKSCEELAQSTGGYPRALYRLLRALACVGVFCISVLF